MDKSITPSRILETGFGFWGSKVLLTAVEPPRGGAVTFDYTSCEDLRHGLAPC